MNLICTTCFNLVLHYQRTPVNPVRVNHPVSVLIKAPLSNRKCFWPRVGLTVFRLSMTCTPVCHLGQELLASTSSVMYSCHRPWSITIIFSTVSVGVCLTHSLFDFSQCSISWNKIIIIGNIIQHQMVRTTGYLLTLTCSDWISVSIHPVSPAYPRLGCESSSLSNDA